MKSNLSCFPVFIPHVATETKVKIQAQRDCTIQYRRDFV